MQPSAWERRSWHGTIPFVPAIDVVFIGCIEYQALATNLDVVVDFDGARPFSGFIFYIRLYAQSGSQKVYMASYGLDPVTGITPNPYGPQNGSAIQSGGSGGYQFLVQAGGLVALNWGIEVGVRALTPGDTLSGIFVCGIAHGREL